MKIGRASECAEECPRDFDWQAAIVCLYSIQHYESWGERRFSYPHGTFYKQIFNVISGLKNSASRKTILNHLQSPECLVCHDTVDIRGKQLDHIIPKSMGGPDNLENTMVLCRKHNSSKGKKDIIEWWSGNGWDAISLPRNILCLYTRLMWQHLHIIFEKPYELPDYVRTFITDRAKYLPTGEHRVSLYGSTYAAIGFLGWEKTHGGS